MAWNFTSKTTASNTRNGMSGKTRRDIHIGGVTSGNIPAGGENKVKS